MLKQLFMDAKRTGILFYLILLQLSALIFVTAKGAGQIYLDLFLILLFITLGMYFYTRIIGGNLKIVIYTVVLLTVGTMLQSIFLKEEMIKNADASLLSNPASGLQFQYLVAFAAAAFAAFLYRKGKFLSGQKSIKIMFLLSVLLYLVTLLFASRVGSAKNWIVIGGFSLQTSEINKFLYVFLMAGILGGVEKPSKKRVGSAFFVTIINLLFLMLQSEFGTMLLILFVFPVFLFLFVPDIRVAIGTIAGYIGAGIITAGSAGLLEFLAVKNETFGSLSFVRFFLTNYEKIANRFIYWLHPEKDPLGFGYQLLKAREAIVLGGWFGTDSVTSLPVKTSDMVFPALIERCGIILAVLVLIVIVLLWLEGIRIFIGKKDRYHSAVCAGMVFMLYYQAMIIVAGSCGMCPLTGITLPFISSGGTSLMVSFVMIGIIITISGKVEWEGVREDEEMEFKFEFFKKNADRTEHITALCHRTGAFFIQNVCRITGYFRGGRSGKAEGGASAEPERICEGTDCRQEWGNSGEFEGTSWKKNL